MQAVLYFTDCVEELAEVRFLGGWLRYRPGIYSTYTGTPVSLRARLLFAQQVILRRGSCRCQFLIVSVSLAGT
jgi:hypothetical protein